MIGRRLEVERHDIAADAHALAVELAHDARRLVAAGLAALYRHEAALGQRRGRRAVVARHAGGGAGEKRLRLRLRPPRRRHELAPFEVHRRVDGVRRAERQQRQGQSQHDTSEALSSSFSPSGAHGHAVGERQAVGPHGRQQTGEQTGHDDRRRASATRAASAASMSRLRPYVRVDPGPQQRQRRRRAARRRARRRRASAARPRRRAGPGWSRGRAPTERRIAISRRRSFSVVRIIVTMPSSAVATTMAETTDSAVSAVPTSPHSSCSAAPGMIADSGSCAYSLMARCSLKVGELRLQADQRRRDRLRLEVHLAHLVGRHALARAPACRSASRRGSPRWPRG